MSKKVLVAARSLQDAHVAALKLATMLRDSTLLDFHIRGSVVWTKTVTVEFVTPVRILDGITCDVPIGFNPEQSRRMARGHEYPKMNSMEDIAKYIIEEESK